MPAFRLCMMLLCSSLLWWLAAGTQWCHVASNSMMFDMQSHIKKEDQECLQCSFFTAKHTVWGHRISKGFDRFWQGQNPGCSSLPTRMRLLPQWGLCMAMWAVSHHSSQPCSCLSGQHFCLNCDPFPTSGRSVVGAPTMDLSESCQIFCGWFFVHWKECRSLFLSSSALLAISAFWHHVWCNTVLHTASQWPTTGRWKVTARESVKKSNCIAFTTALSLHKSNHDRMMLVGEGAWNKMPACASMFAVRMMHFLWWDNHFLPRSLVDCKKAQTTVKTSHRPIRLRSKSMIREELKNSCFCPKMNVFPGKNAQLWSTLLHYTKKCLEKIPFQITPCTKEDRNHFIVCVKPVPL